LKRTAYVRSRETIEKTVSRETFALDEQMRFWSVAEELSGDVRSLIAGACAAAGCSIDDLLSPSRRRPVVAARRIERLVARLTAAGDVVKMARQLVVGLLLWEWLNQ